MRAVEILSTILMGLEHTDGGHKASQRDLKAALLQQVPGRGGEMAPMGGFQNRCEKRRLFLKQTKPLQVLNEGQALMTG